MTDKIIVDAEGLMESFNNPSEGFVKYVCGKNPDACEKIISIVNMSSKNNLSINTSSSSSQPTSSSSPFDTMVKEFSASSEKEMEMPQEVVTMSQIQSPVSVTSVKTINIESPKVLESPTQISRETADAIKEKLDASPLDTKKEALVIAAIAANAEDSAKKNRGKGKALSAQQTAQASVDSITFLRNKLASRRSATTDSDSDSDDDSDSNRRRSVTDFTDEDWELNKTPSPVKPPVSEQPTGQSSESKKRIKEHGQFLEKIFSGRVAKTVAVAGIAVALHQAGTGVGVAPQDATNIVNNNVAIASKNITQFSNNTVFGSVPFEDKYMKGTILFPIGSIPEAETKELWKVLSPSTTTFDDSRVPPPSNTTVIDSRVPPPPPLPPMPNTGITVFPPALPPGKTTTVSSLFVPEPTITNSYDYETNEEVQGPYTVAQPTSLPSPSVPFSPSKYSFDFIDLRMTPKEFDDMMKRYNNVDVKELVKSTKELMFKQLEKIVDVTESAKDKGVTIVTSLMAYLEKSRQEGINLEGFNWVKDNNALIALLLSLFGAGLIPLIIRYKGSKNHKLAIRNPLSRELIQITLTYDNKYRFQKIGSARFYMGEYLFR